PQVAPGRGPHLMAARRAPRLDGEHAAVLLGPDVEDRHLEELAAGPAVLPPRGVVHFEKSEGLAPVHPHGGGIAIEQRPICVRGLDRVAHNGGRVPPSGPPSAWRTVRRRRSSEKGFSRNSIPGSSSRSRATDPSLVPEM